MAVEEVARTCHSVLLQQNLLLLLVGLVILHLHKAVDCTCQGSGVAYAVDRLHNQAEGRSAPDAATTVRDPNLQDHKEALVEVVYSFSCIFRRPLLPSPRCDRHQVEADRFCSDDSTLADQEERPVPCGEGHAAADYQDTYDLVVLDGWLPSVLRIDHHRAAFRPYSPAWDVREEGGHLPVDNDTLVAVVLHYTLEALHRVEPDSHFRRHRALTVSHSFHPVLAKLPWPCFTDTFDIIGSPSKQ